MKNKINNYDFLIIGAGLIGALTALTLLKKNQSVLITDKNTKIPNDSRTLAVNANSKEFLERLGIWGKLKSQPEPIKKIIIKDNINNIPVIFENNDEEMGNVIFNNELRTVASKELKNKKALIDGVQIDISSILPYKKISIKGKNYIFKNIILCLGKKYNFNSSIKKFSFPTGHSSCVGFFNHSINHQQTAYEVFTPEGPLAVLPSPNKLKKQSTFIYSSKKTLSRTKMNLLLKRHFSKTHGSINIFNKLGQFKIFPHLSFDKLNNYILIGDNFRSIHPVAGQGWNLGIKDIQCLESLLDLYGPNNPELIGKYYSQRSLDNISYLSFTSSLNFLYENQNVFTKFIIKTGFSVLRNFSLLRNAFIKQAMGRSNLIG